MWLVSQILQFKHFQMLSVFGILFSHEIFFLLAFVRTRDSITRMTTLIQTTNNLLVLFCFVYFWCLFLLLFFFIFFSINNFRFFSFGKQFLFMVATYCCPVYIFRSTNQVITRFQKGTKAISEVIYKIFIYIKICVH